MKTKKIIISLPEEKEMLIASTAKSLGMSHQNLILAVLAGRVGILEYSHDATPWIAPLDLPVVRRGNPALIRKESK